MKVTKNYAWINPKIVSDRIDGGFYKVEDINILNKIFKSNMEVKSLLDISKDIKDGPHDGYTFVDKGVLFIRSQNIKNAGFDISDKKYITKEFHDKFKKSWLELGDLLITRIGEYYGNAAVVSSEYVGTNINHAIAKVKLRKDVNPYYVCAYINSSIGNKIYRRLGKSFTSPRVNLGDYSEVLIPIPSLEIQKYIGDKVRKAEELREKAKRLKKEAEDLLNEELSLKHLESSKTKNKFDWLNNEILTDRIDSDYYKEEFIITIKHLKKSLKKYTTLKDTVQEMYTGKNPVEFNDGTEMYFVQSGNISSNFLELNDKVKVDIEKYKPIQYGDLLMAKDGETIGKLAINYTGKNIILNEHTYCLKFKKEYKTYGAYIYYLLTNTNINTLIRREATGSAQKGLNQQFLESIIIPIISETVINEFHNLEEKRCECIYKSKNLIKQAKQDIEDLIEGNFDMSKMKETN